MLAFKVTLVLLLILPLALALPVAEELSPANAEGAPELKPISKNDIKQVEEHLDELREQNVAILKLNVEEAVANTAINLKKEEASEAFSRHKRECRYIPIFCKSLSRVLFIRRC